MVYCLFEVIFRPRYPRPSVRAIRKYYHPSVRAIENIAVRASALFKILPSERPLFSKYYHPSVQNHKILTSSALISAQLWVTARLQALFSPVLTHKCPNTVWGWWSCYHCPEPRRTQNSSYHNISHISSRCR